MQCSLDKNTDLKTGAAVIWHLKCTYLLMLFSREKRSTKTCIITFLHISDPCSSQWRVCNLNSLPFIRSFIVTLQLPSVVTIWMKCRNPGAMALLCISHVRGIGSHQLKWMVLSGTVNVELLPRIYQSNMICCWIQDPIDFSDIYL